MQDHGPYGNRALSDVPADVPILVDTPEMTATLNFVAKNFGLVPVKVPAVSGASATGAQAYDINSNPAKRPYVFIGPKGDQPNKSRGRLCEELGIAHTKYRTEARMLQYMFPATLTDTANLLGRSVA